MTMEEPAPAGLGAFSDEVSVSVTPPDIPGFSEGPLRNTPASGAGEITQPTRPRPPSADGRAPVSAVLDVDEVMVDLLSPQGIRPL